MSVYLLLAGAVIAYFLLLAWLSRTNPDTDRELAAVDEDIDRRRIADAQERAAADQLRQAAQRHGAPAARARGHRAVPD